MWWGSAKANKKKPDVECSRQAFSPIFLKEVNELSSALKMNTEQ
jgi:hypothetical protein